MWRLNMCSKNVKSIKFVVICNIRCVLSSSKCTATARRVYDASPDPLVGWGWGHSFLYPPPRRLRRLDLGAYRAPRFLGPSKKKF